VACQPRAMLSTRRHSGHSVSITSSSSFTHYHTCVIRHPGASDRPGLATYPRLQVGTERRSLLSSSRGTAAARTIAFVPQAWTDSTTPLATTRWPVNRTGCRAAMIVGRRSSVVGRRSPAVVVETSRPTGRVCGYRRLAGPATRAPARWPTAAPPSRSSTGGRLNASVVCARRAPGPPRASTRTAAGVPACEPRAGSAARGQ
jgi:hypothetical protein